MIQCVSLFLQAVRVTKPHIPESVLRNYELMWVCFFLSNLLKSDGDILSTITLECSKNVEPSQLKLLSEVVPNGSFPVLSLDNLSLSLICSYKPRNAAQVFDFCTVPCAK